MERERGGERGGVWKDREVVKIDNEDITIREKIIKRLWKKEKNILQRNYEEIHEIHNEEREWLDIIEKRIERQRSSLLFVQGQFEE